MNLLETTVRVIKQCIFCFKKPKSRCPFQGVRSGKRTICCSLSSMIVFHFLGCGSARILGCGLLAITGFPKTFRACIRSISFSAIKNTTSSMHWLNKKRKITKSQMLWLFWSRQSKFVILIDALFHKISKDKVPHWFSHRFLEF